MANFTERVEALSGVTSGAGTSLPSDLISTWLTESARDVINMLPPQILYIAGNTELIISSDAGGPSDSSSTVPESRILGVERVRNPGYRPYECLEIDFTERGKAEKDSGYMEEATVESPVFYRLNNAIHILPLLQEHADGFPYGLVTYVSYPTVYWDDDNIPKFPNEIEHLVVLKAAVKAKFYQIGLANKEEDLEVATSHTNHMSALNQEYAMAIQGFMSGFGINAKEQGATQNIMVRGEQ